MTDVVKKLVLVGQPNAGKSTLFNVLSDKKTSTSNFAGTTVSKNETLVSINGETFSVVDLPGTYSLNPSDAAEEVTYNYLISNNIDLVVNVVDASMLSRSLELTMELVELNMPMVLALNMQDEAERRGVTIDRQKLEKMLNIPVVPITALFGKGIKALTDKCFDAVYEKKYEPEVHSYTHHIETHIEGLEEKINPLLIGNNGSSRYYAIKSIENPQLVPDYILEGINPDLKLIGQELFDQHRKESFEVISYERHHQAMKISEQITDFKHRKSRSFSDRLDDYLLHPVAGYVFLLAFFAVYFAVIFIVGNLLTTLVNIPLEALAAQVDRLKDVNPFVWLTVNGAYQGIIGAAGIVLPYFLPLVFLTSVFEDTGYLARIAFLIDGVMHKMGLHGKSVVAFILGFACSVPAIYSTRIMENRKERMLTAMLIPFVPCSARITVIFALTAAFTGPLWAVIVFFFVLIIIGLSGRLLSKFITNPTGLILEIPNLKSPALSSSFRKTWYKTKDFLKSATLFLVLGSIFLSWVEYFNAAQYLNIVFSPIVKGVLGLPEQLGSTLLFGFFRKELIVVMTSQALGVSSLDQLPMTVHQVIVFIIFVTLYFPCFTTFVVIWKEFGSKIAGASAVMSIVVATLSALLFKIVLGM